MLAVCINTAQKSLNYGDVIYNSVNKEGLLRLQRLQNRCLKSCMRLNLRFETDDLHRVTKRPKLKTRRTAHFKIFMYKRLDIQHLLDMRDIRTRGHDAPLFKIKILYEAFKGSVEYARALQWNGLPQATRNTENIEIFKVKQKAIMEGRVVPE